MDLNIQDFINVGINRLYHLTYLENIDSILKNNILSRSKQEKMNINPTNYSNLEIVSKLQEKHQIIDDFVPVFFNKYSPMLYELNH